MGCWCIRVGLIMYYLKVKDNNLRKAFKKLELQLILKKFIYHNILSYLYFFKKYDLYSYAYFNILKKKKKRILTKYVNRCVLSNRSKSIRCLKLSRIKARELISFGIIPGFKKAIW